MIEFFMPMKKVPTVTHQMKKVHVVNGKPIFYEPDELKRARSQLTGLLLKNAPQVKFGRSVRLVTKWCFPITGKHHDGEYKYTKPDTDNLQKVEAYGKSPNKRAIHHNKRSGKFTRGEN